MAILAMVRFFFGTAVIHVGPTDILNHEDALLVAEVAEEH
jgi:hypothetical protein